MDFLSTRWRRPRQQVLSESPKPFEFNIKTLKAGSFKNLHELHQKQIVALSVLSFEMQLLFECLSKLITLRTEVYDPLYNELKNWNNECSRTFPTILKFVFGQIQTHGCQQVADEVEREYKKMSQRINEGSEAMNGSYSTFMAELQASGARCKFLALCQL
ncbi:hypothetical protein HAX54_032071 [Datura stramonium]|uniref:Uncharacterized protein n=1 Tax=Datura stramonium TaxID=4076 RepID=A0ABS8VD44_DATST|nr:hypothetical protein [Datura stramonium]